VRQTCITLVHHKHRDILQQASPAKMLPAMIKRGLPANTSRLRVESKMAAVRTKRKLTHERTSTSGRLALCMPMQIVPV
jgi:hypothetical protein